MAPLKPGKAPRRIAVFAFENAQILDITGPLEVFARTTRLLRDRGSREPGYSVEIIAPKAGAFACSSGLQLIAAHGIGQVKGAIDTLLVAGGMGVVEMMQDRAALAFLRRASKQTRRFGSVCTGALLLAAAGLLDGKRATTHWRSCAWLAERYPKVTVEPDPIFVKDGRVYTSAGVTAGMDLALALVEEDYGRKTALRVARELVMFVQRPGGQSQFSAQLSAQLAQSRPLRELQAFISEHVKDDLSIEACARRAAMSPRNFARRFALEVGMTPAAYVEAARVEAARRRLEETEDGVEAIALECGFGTAETMRRAFLRSLKVGPSEYRARFRSTLARTRSRQRTRGAAATVH